MRDDLRICIRMEFIRLLYCNPSLFNDDTVQDFRVGFTLKRLNEYEYNNG